MDTYKNGNNYAHETGQFSIDYVSDRLKYMLKHYFNVLTYRKLSDFLLDHTGTRLLGASQLKNKAQTYAAEATENKLAIYDKLQLVLPYADSTIDLYSAESKEIHLFDDAIGVASQKEVRNNPNYKKKEKRIQSDVVELQLPDGSFEYITSGIDKQGKECMPIHLAIVSAVSFWYGQSNLPIVAITDGARSIRKRLYEIFGKTITIILDWYHLNKKIWNLMSMIAKTKAEKEIHARIIQNKLWQGEVNDAIAYIQLIETKNEVQKQNLIDYLTKHSHEIINYDKRKKVGKTIGSGRAEKGCDVIVGMRQKKKGTSWTRKGSHSLGILKAQEKNYKVVAA